MTDRIQQLPWRRRRAAAFGLVGSLVGVVGHAAASGTSVDWMLVPVFVLVLTAYGWLARDRVVSLVESTAMLIGAQLLVHIACDAIVTPSVGMQHAGHAAHQALAGRFDGAAMLVFHGVAALLGALLLRRLDVVAWRRIRRALRALVDATTAREPRIPRSHRAPVAFELPRRRARWHAVVNGRRGPPSSATNASAPSARPIPHIQEHTVNFSHLKPALAALVAASLALPAAAAAHPAVYTVTPQTGTNERQQLVVTGTGGTFVPHTGAAAVAFDATASALEASLEGTAINDVFVTRTGTGPYTYSIVYTGTDNATNMADLVTNGALLTGPGAGVAFSTLAQGVAKVQSAVRYVYANHGYPVVANETNGVTNGGGIAYARFPSAMRTGLSTEAQLLLARDIGAVTGVQVHATCDVAALKTEAVIADWQDVDAPGTANPFYDYIPFQSTAGGFDDVAANWIPVVQVAVGVDLTGMNAAAAEAACEGLPGANASSYKVVDTPTGAIGAIAADWSAEQVTAATGPLNTQITGLNADKTALTADKATLTSQKTALENEKSVLTAANAALTTAKTALEAQLAKATEDGKRPLTFTAAGNRFNASASHLLTGEAGDKATVTVHISDALQKALKLKSDAIAMDKVTLDAQGAAIVQPNVSRAAARALGRRSSTPVTVKIVSGDTTLTAKATLIA